MSSVRVEMDGLKDLQSKLSQLTIKPGVVDKVLEVGAEHVRGEIEKLVKVRTGDLKISIAKGEVSSDGAIEVGPSQQGPDFRAHFLEFGTSEMPAQPYMRPGFNASIRVAQTLMANELKKELRL